MVSIYNDGNKRVLVGVVEEVREYTKDGVKKAILKLKDREGGVTSIFYANKDAGPQLADRLLKIKPEKGTPLVAVAYVDEGKDVGNGVDFRFKKSVIPMTTERGEVNIIFGTICGQREISPTAVGVSVPVAVWNKDTRANDEYFASVSFFDTEGDEKKNFASRARKLLFAKDPATSSYKNHVGAIVCGGMTEKEVNGRVYKNYSGWRVELLDSIE